MPVLGRPGGRAAVPRAGRPLVRRAVRLLAVLAVAAVVLPSVAHASALGLRSAAVTTVQQTRCGDATVTVTPGGLTSAPTTAGTSARATALVGRGTAATCAGRPVTVEAYRRATGVVVTSGSATVGADGSFSATVPAYAASGDLATRVVVGGWAVPAAWSAPVSCVAVNDPTRTCEVRWTVTSGTVNVLFWSYRYVRVAWTVTSPSTTANVTWRVTFDTSALAPFVPERIRRTDTVATMPTACATLPAFTLQGGTPVGGATSTSGSFQLDERMLLDVYDSYPLC